MYIVIKLHNYLFTEKLQTTKKTSQKLTRKEIPKKTKKEKNH